MTSQIKKGKRYLVNGYWTLVSTASALLISLQPIMADTIWDRFSKIMRDVYGQLAGISSCHCCGSRTSGSYDFKKPACS